MQVTSLTRALALAQAEDDSPSLGPAPEGTPEPRDSEPQAGDADLLLAVTGARLLLGANLDGPDSDPPSPAMPHGSVRTPFPHSSACSASGQRRHVVPADRVVRSSPAAFLPCRPGAARSPPDSDACSPAQGPSRSVRSGRTDRPRAHRDGLWWCCTGRPRSRSPPARRNHVFETLRQVHRSPGICVFQFHPPASARRSASPPRCPR